MFFGYFGVYSSVWYSICIVNRIMKPVLNVVLDTLKKGFDFLGYLFLAYCFYIILNGMFDFLTALAVIETK